MSDRTMIDTVDGLCEEAQSLASKLFQIPCEKPDPGSCIRKLGKIRGGGFMDFDAKAMCEPCAAYWHAQMASNILLFSMKARGKP